mmetsp:Transcript_6501/g.11620  ORF Transcript_6501/g.11620 Transcript_6501/m.11620 type:complete len:147 (+) Transcript_6501:43-483(+)
MGEQKRLSAQREREVQEAFTLFDVDSTGKIETAEVGNLLRSLGCIPTGAQIEKIVADSGPSVDIQQFMQIVEKHEGESMTESDIIAAFKVFDKKGTGYISAEELRTALTTEGEKLSEEDVEAVLAESGVSSDGMINYHVLSKKLAL